MFQFCSYFVANKYVISYLYCASLSLTSLLMFQKQLLFLKLSLKSQKPGVKKELFGYLEAMFHDKTHNRNV